MALTFPRHVEEVNIGALPPDTMSDFLSLIGAEQKCTFERREKSG
jgi:hypothetical protein